MHMINKSVLVLLLAFFSTIATAAPKSHTHINNLLKTWPDAPKQMGLLPTALKEAAIASLYIKLSRVQDKDLAWIKLHINKAKHALKAREGEEGGLGFGLVKASYAIAKETKLAASDNASISVKLRSKTIIMSAYNTAGIAKKMERICKKVDKSITIAQALTYVDELEALSSTLLKGVDLDNDGEITAFSKEGGLNMARDQLIFMARAEGLIKAKKK